MICGPLLFHSAAHYTRIKKCTPRQSHSLDLRLTWLRPSAHAGCVGGFVQANLNILTQEPYPRFCQRYRSTRNVSEHRLPVSTGQLMACLNSAHCCRQAQEKSFNMLTLSHMVLSVLDSRVIKLRYFLHSFVYHVVLLYKIGNHPGLDTHSFNWGNLGCVSIST